LKGTGAKLLAFLLAVALAIGVHPVFAHLRHENDAGDSRTSAETPFGREGDPQKVSRTIDVEVDDHLRYRPSKVTVKEGETILFRIKNSGRALHELVLGTIEELKEHARLMRQHTSRAHDEPFMAHVEPGNTETIVWQFTKPGEFYYGCLIAGHLEAGMLGTIIVQETK
jgi:uncharacterized cupredoxin-like copper-binding protein